MKLVELASAKKLTSSLNLKTFTAWCIVLTLLVGVMIVISDLDVNHSDYNVMRLAASHLLHGDDVYAAEANGVQILFNPVWVTFPFICFPAWVEYPAACRVSNFVLSFSIPRGLPRE